ncbi:MAG: dephospho-CoA kinase, partial [Clostridia bacterium]
MLTIGITGPSGAGKSEVAGIFATFGFEIIDGDVVAREVTQKGSICLWELTKSFGNILDENEELDREVLSEIVFASEESLSLLNEITHKYIIENILEKMDDLSRRGIDRVCIDAAALIESGFNTSCDFVVAVIAPLPVRLVRILRRDKITRSAALHRLLAQPEDDFYINNSDYIIENVGDTKKNNVLGNQIIDFFKQNDIEYEE